MLTPTERRHLLQLARQALAATVAGLPWLTVEEACLPLALRRPGCCFVTLSRGGPVEQGGELRGCIGGLTAFRPLYQDVCHNTQIAARDDPRFAPVSAAELPAIEIEISVLTRPEALAYTGPADLVQRLRPQVDGVILAHGKHCATFLPQVWERVPEPERFLGLLCQKLGARPEAWRQKHFEVLTYQVEKLTESDCRLEPVEPPADLPGPAA